MCSKRDEERKGSVVAGKEVVESLMPCRSKRYAVPSGYLVSCSSSRYVQAEPGRVLAHGRTCVSLPGCSGRTRVRSVIRYSPAPLFLLRVPSAPAPWCFVVHAPVVLLRHRSASPSGSGADCQSTEDEPPPEQYCENIADTRL